MKRRLITIWVVVASLQILFAQSLVAASSRDTLFRQKFVNYSVEDGLPSSVVYDVIQDSLGFMWFATESGLSRFDGYKFQNYTIEDGLPDNDIIGLTQDSRGLIWLHSLSGLAFFVPSLSPKFYSKNEFEGYAFRTVSIQNDKYRILVVKDGKTKVISYDLQSHQFDLDTINHVGKTIEIEGQFWKETKENLQLVYPKGKTKTISKNGIAISKIITTKNQKAFFRGMEGIYFFDGKAIAQLAGKYASWIPPDEVFKMFIDADENLWVSTQEKGLLLFPKDFKGSPERFPSLGNHPISNLCKDNQGNYWFTSLSDGVFFLSRYQGFSKNYIPPGSSIGKRVQTVSNIENQIIALGMGNAKVMVLDRSGLRKIEWQPSNRFQKIRGVISYNKDTILAYGDNEIALFTYQKEEPFAWIMEEGFKDMIVGQDHGIWFGRSSYWGRIPPFSLGPAIQSGGHPTMSSNPYFQRGVAIWPDRDQAYLWIGNPAGLRLWQLENDQITKGPWFVLKASILDIDQSPEGDIWVSTDGKGVFVVRGGYSPSNFQFKHFSIENGILSSNTCRKVVFGNSGEVLVATNNGISIIRDFSWDQTADFFETDHLSNAHGLLSNSINDLAIFDDTLYVGTDKGLTIFDHERVQKRSKGNPKVLVTEVRISEKDTLVQDYYELDYHQRNIKFGFVALNYSSLKNIQYHYQLYPLEKTWITTLETYAHYPFLEPGNYTFKVKAVDADGVESSSTTEIDIYVAPIWWDTSWFKLGAITALFLFFGGIFLYRVRLIRRQEKLKSNYHQQIADYQRQTLASQMNPHFIFNALVAVQGFILKSDVRAANKYLAKFSNLIRNVLEGSQNKTIPLSEEIKTLQLYLELEHLRFGDRFDYNIDIAPDLFPGSLRIPPMILQPFVENAIRHGLKPLRGEGHLLVAFQMEEDLLKCVIEDNGVGRKSAMKLKSMHHTEYQSRGMELTMKRIELLNVQMGKRANVVVEDLVDSHQVPRGTRITLYIPSI